MPNDEIERRARDAIGRTPQRAEKQEYEAHRKSVITSRLSAIKHLNANAEVLLDDLLQDLIDICRPYIGKKPDGINLHMRRDLAHTDSGTKRGILREVEQGARVIVGFELLEKKAKALIEEHRPPCVYFYTYPEGTRLLITINDDNLFLIEEQALNARSTSPIGAGSGTLKGWSSQERAPQARTKKETIEFLKDRLVNHLVAVRTDAARPFWKKHGGKIAAAAVGLTALFTMCNGTPAQSQENPDLNSDQAFEVLIPN